MRRRGASDRKAFALYGLLIVLPTLVLGGLHWRQLVLDHENRLGNVPLRAEDAAQRLVAAIRSRVDELLGTEDQRPFYLYADLYAPEGTLADELVLQQTPLGRITRPPGVLGWLSYDLTDGPRAEVDFFMGLVPGDAEHARGQRVLEGSLRVAVASFVPRYYQEPWLLRASRLANSREVELPLIVAAVNRGQSEFEDCLAACYGALRTHTLPIWVSPFELHVWMEGDVPRVLATRRALLLEEVEPSDAVAPCLAPLADGFGLVQGFFLDADWLFGQVPDGAARSVLGDSERFLRRGEREACVECSEYHASIDLVRELDLDTGDGELDRAALEEFGTLQVAIDSGELHARFRGQMWRFFGVAAMLVLALGTGTWLLASRVQRELEQARRMQNFVSAVTHELRTPLSAIRLHGEMLLEGWASDAKTQQEYYRRIVNETGRLSTLVDRVLEQGKLAESRVQLERIDLDALVQELGERLVDGTWSEAKDVELVLGGDLPSVWGAREPIEGILVNLVENARKYAPVDLSDPSSEPIRVSTGRDGERVVLEVSDRGPGIPPEESKRVFEAFYRRGNEATRTAKGTGLGLHLVDLHARSIGGAASVHPREGGGSVFRVCFRTAD